MRDVSREESHGSRRSDGGFSLIEVLLALGLATLVVLGLAAGVLTTMRSSEVAASRQRREAALTSFSESLKSMPYVECTSGGATASGYLATYSVGMSTGATWSPAQTSDVADLDVEDVEYWQPAASGASAGTYSANCAGVDHGAQRLTVSLTVRGQRVHGQVVLRRST